jgi:hypothetical protein
MTIGDAPPVDTATVSGPRWSTEGLTKLETLCVVDDVDRETPGSSELCDLPAQRLVAEEGQRPQFTQGARRVTRQPPPERS